MLTFITQLNNSREILRVHHEHWFLSAFAQLNTSQTKRREHITSTRSTSGEVRKRKVIITQEPATPVIPRGPKRNTIQLC